MDLTFSPQEERFRDEVRDWLARNVPREKRPADDAGKRRFDLDWQRTQYDGGWAGLSWPQAYGGRGLSLIQQVIWFEELARARAPGPNSLFVAVNHAGPTLIARGSEEQKAFHLPKILRGEVVWCQGFSEPSAGSDLASLRTRGVVEGDELVVTGQKVWSSNAQFADYQELLVRTDPEAPKHKGITWVICDMRLPGITVRPIRSISGVPHFTEIFYDEVRIPIGNVVGGVNEGWGVAMATLSFERGTALIGYQMELQRTVETLIAKAREADRRGVFMGDIFPRLARARAEVAGLRAMAYATVSRQVHHPVPGPEGALNALYFADLAKRVHRLSVDMFEEASVTRSLDDEEEDWGVAYLESLRHTIAGGTGEIRRNVIGERVLGLPRGR